MGVNILRWLGLVWAQGLSMWNFWKECQGAQKMGRRKKSMEGICMGRMAWPMLIHHQTLTETPSVPDSVQGILRDSSSDPSLKKLKSFWAGEVSWTHGGFLTSSGQLCLRTNEWLRQPGLKVLRKGIWALQTGSGWAEGFHGMVEFETWGIIG